MTPPYRALLPNALNALALLAGQGLASLLGGGLGVVTGLDGSAVFYFLAGVIALVALPVVDEAANYDG